METEMKQKELTAEDRETLRTYVRLVYDMSECRFIKSIRNEDQTVSGSVDENGNPTTSGPDYDWEDFRSFMTVFRKVAINENDRTYFTKILKIVGKYAGDAFRGVLKKSKKEAMARLKGYWTGILVGAVIEGKEVKYNVAQLLDAITNGEIFHSGPEHQTALKLLDQDHRAVLWPVIHFKILPILGMMVGLFHDLWRDNILATADYPAPCQQLKIEWEKKGAANQAE